MHSPLYGLFITLILSNIIHNKLDNTLFNNLFILERRIKAVLLLLGLGKTFLSFPSGSENNHM